MRKLIYSGSVLCLTILSAVSAYANEFTSELVEKTIDGALVVTFMGAVAAAIVGIAKGMVVLFS